MTDGLFINMRRPKSKKEVKEAVKENPLAVEVECTSMFGGYSGPVSEMPDGTTITFVGPDPYSKRNFYGNIKRNGDKITVT
jgi:hypothetical protein